MFWFFRRRRQIERLKEDVQKSFDLVKEDFNKVGKWIKHLDEKKENHSKEISEIKSVISEIQTELGEIKGLFPFFSEGVSKQPQTVFNKQTGVKVVQTAVQTAVQTGIFLNFTLMERAIVLTLINSDMKLSYEDLAALLGKSKSTIRGQINTIKQKSEGLIMEIREGNGKKRVFIPEKTKEIILKSVKVRVKKSEKNKEKEEKGENKIG